MFTMHGRIQKILSGGGGGVECPENFILVFHRGQCGPGLPFEAIGTQRGPSLSRGCQ